MKRYVKWMIGLLFVVALVSGCAKRTSDGSTTTTKPTESTSTKAPETTTEAKKEVTVDEVLKAMGENVDLYPYVSGTYLLNVNRTKGEETKESILDSEFEATKAVPVVHRTGQLTEEDNTVGMEDFVCEGEDGKVKVMRLREDAWSEKDEDPEKVNPKSADDFLSLLTLPAYTGVTEKEEEGKALILLNGKLNAEILEEFFAQIGLLNDLKEAPEFGEEGAEATLIVDAATMLPIELKVSTATEKDDTKTAVSAEIDFVTFDKTKTVEVPLEDIQKAIEAQKKAKENERTAVWVDVDLTKQYVYLYKDGQVIASSPCVTGCVADGNGTPTGTFHVAYKQKNRTLRGTNRDGTKYESFVKYWISFNGSIGLHDASWRSNFSASRAWNHGSHGCVNLPTKFAATLYDTVSAGDVVYVHGWPEGSHVHTFGDWVIDSEPTCKTEGKKLLKCKSCGKAVKYEMIPIDKNAHVWDKGTVTKEATETEEGSILFTCTLCGATKTESIPKKETTTKETTTEETTTEETTKETTTEETTTEETTKETTTEETTTEETTKETTTEETTTEETTKETTTEETTKETTTEEKTEDPGDDQAAIFYRRVFRNLEWFRTV